MARAALRLRTHSSLFGHHRAPPPSLLAMALQQRRRSLFQTTAHAIEKPWASDGRCRASRSRSTVHKLMISHGQVAEA